jgi:uncharacterized membrane protein (UPF0127 family)
MKEIYVDIADTPTKLAQGLMGVKSMDSNKGMLFKFKDSNHRSFWMSNTYIPLDIAFISDEGKILQISEMIPHATRPVYSADKCKYALETNKGWFKDNDIPVGSTVNIGGMGMTGLIRIAQMTPPVLEEDADIDQGEFDLNVEEIPEEEAQEEEPVEPPASDYQANQTFKQRFQRLNAHNRLKVNADRQGDMLVFYQTEEYGIELLPRVCQGPFTLEGGVNGELVRLLDVSPVVSGSHPDGSPWTIEPGEKTFLLGNIIHMTEVLRNDPSQDISGQIVAWLKEQSNAPDGTQQYMDLGI